MPGLNQLAQLIKQIEDQMTDCMKCGMCQAVCPVFTETGDEGDVARGKIFLLERLSDRMIEDASGVKKRLDKCLLCGSCAASCPSGVRILEIFVKARAALTQYEGLSAVKKLIFRGMLKHPARLNMLTDLAAMFQWLGTCRANTHFGTCRAPMLKGMIGGRHFKPISKKPLHKTTPSLDTPAGKSGVKVAFFPGCVVDKMNPEIGSAALKVFEHHGVGVFMPSNQACCGIPALASGDQPTFEDLLVHNIERFANQEFDYLITPCATCTATLKELWPMLADERSEAAVMNLAGKVMDISQFLVDVLGVKADDTKTGTKVTYHSPCHLGKSLEVTAQPRTLLAAGAEFVEMEEAEYCCGNGGSFNLQHYELSTRIGERKRKNILDSGADVVATSCPACMMQMTDLLSRNQDKVRVKHVVELYAEALD